MKWLETKYEQKQQHQTPLNNSIGSSLQLKSFVNGALLEAQHIIILLKFESLDTLLIDFVIGTQNIRLLLIFLQFYAFLCQTT